MIAEELEYSSNINTRCFLRVLESTLYSNVHIQIGNSSRGKIFDVLLGMGKWKEVRMYIG